ncbi:Uncharacterized protein SCF082_LOCUS44273 [Durusdinium trenchii]|uniref:Uncharacterized protein n=1 Tax=Durusdinium trenchii TaxID=1381693 RepID=A0ABP0R0U4_9DINO
MQTAWLQEGPMPDINMKVDLGFDPSLAAPSKLFMVKGWNRSVCCLTTLWAMFELPGLYEAGKYTQARFITHESLAMNLLNVGFNRLGSKAALDYPALHRCFHIVQFINFIDSMMCLKENLQRICAGYMALLDQFMTMVPKSFADSVIPDINKTFAMRHADHDILHMLEHSVPPADVTKVALFSSPLAKFKHEAGLDLKYLSDRYQKGKAAVENMMNKCHRFTHQSSIIMAHNAIVSMQNELGTNGFAEWSGASWLLQRDWLTKEKDDKSVDIRYLGVYHDADAAVMKSAKDSVAGRMLSQWWDKSDEAGATSRPNATFGVEPPKLEVLSYSDHGHLRIPDVLQQKFKPSHGAALQACLDALADETAIAKALVAYHGGSPTTTSPTKADAPRTVANPDWQGEAVVNFRKRLHLSGVPITDFESSNSLDACAKLAREPSLEAAVTTTGHLFLVNKTEKDIALPAGELFGFNLEHAATLDASLSWLVSDDKQLVALIKEGTDKELMSLAEVVCSVAKNKGITECKIIDHELQPKLKAHHV